MSKIVIRRKMYFPGFGAGKWRKADHAIPLKLQLGQATALIYLDEDDSQRDTIVFPKGRFEFHYDPAPPTLYRGLLSRGPASRIAASIIYDAYVDAYSKFEALLYSAGRVRYLIKTGPRVNVGVL